MRTVYRFPSLSKVYGVLINFGPQIATSSESTDRTRNKKKNLPNKRSNCPAYVGDQYWAPSAYCERKLRNLESTTEGGRLKSPIVK